MTTAFQLQNYLATIPGLTAPGAVTVTGANGGPFNVAFGAGIAGGTALSSRFRTRRKISEPGMTITGESLSLNGAGIVDPVTLAGSGVLRNVSGANTWQVIPNTVSGNVTLQTNVVIGVDTGTQLAISSPIQDPTNARSGSRRQPYQDWHRHPRVSERQHLCRQNHRLRRHLEHPKCGITRRRRAGTTGRQCHRPERLIRLEFQWIVDRADQRQFIFVAGRHHYGLE